jgi:hypothetical protein
MNNDEEIIDAVVTGIVNEGVDEAVKLVVTKSAMEIIVEVVRDMLKSDSSMSTLKELVRHDVIDCINNKIEAQVNERVHKAVEEAQLKAGLQAELELVSSVHNLSGLLISDLHLGQEGFRHQSCCCQDPGGLPRVALSRV